LQVSLSHFNSLMVSALDGEGIRAEFVAGRVVEQDRRLVILFRWMLLVVWAINFKLPSGH
jgi:hypothetical protein